MQGDCFTSYENITSLFQTLFPPGPPSPPMINNDNNDNDKDKDNDTKNDNDNIYMYTEGVTSTCNIS